MIIMIIMIIIIISISIIIRFVSAAEETAEKALKSSSITPEGQVPVSSIQYPVSSITPEGQVRSIANDYRGSVFWKCFLVTMME